MKEIWNRGHGVEECLAVDGDLLFEQAPDLLISRNPPPLVKCVCMCVISGAVH